MLSAPPQTPNYVQGLARLRGDSAYPELWDGLIGLWAPFLGPTGEMLFDWSGYQNDGTLTNMDPATDWVGSSRGWALDFNGGSEWAQIPWYPDPRSPITVAVHAKLDWSVSGYLFGVHDGVNRFYFGKDVWGVGDSYTGPVTVTSNEWHTWFLLADGGAAWLYEDTNLVDSLSYSASAASTVAFRLGARNHASAGPMTGQITWGMAWDNVLGAGARQQIVDDPFALLRPRRRMLRMLPAIGGPYHAAAGQAFHAGTAEGELFSTGSIIGECDGRSG